MVFKIIKFLLENNESHLIPKQILDIAKKSKLYKSLDSSLFSSTSKTTSKGLGYTNKVSQNETLQSINFTAKDNRTSNGSSMAKSYKESLTKSFKSGFVTADSSLQMQNDQYKDKSRWDR